MLVLPGVAALSVARVLGLLLLMALSTSQAALADAFMVFGAHDGFPKYYEENGEAKGIVVDISRQCMN